MSSTPYVPVGGGETREFAYDYDDEHGQGLVTFAGVMLMIAAVLNTLYGIAAIDKANFFVHDARYVFGELNTWGWFLVALGVVQFFAALAIWRGAPRALDGAVLRDRVTVLPHRPVPGLREAGGGRRRRGHVLHRLDPVHRGRRPPELAQLP